MEYKRLMCIPRKYKWLMGYSMVYHKSALDIYFIYNDFLVFWLTVFSIAWYKVTYHTEVMHKQWSYTVLPLLILLVAQALTRSIFLGDNRKKRENGKDTTSTLTMLVTPCWRSSLSWPSRDGQGEWACAFLTCFLREFWLVRQTWMMITWVQK